MRRMLAPLPPDRWVRRFAQLLAGLVLFGVTAAMLVLAGLGLDPWNVLHQGLSRTFGLGIGTWTIIVSFVALIGWLPLPNRPGVGTLANAVLIGLVIDVVLALVHPPHAILARIALLAGGILGMALATGLYIGAGLGAGPRDGLSVGIAARGHSMRIVRTSVEATVLLVGYLLGGDRRHRHRAVRGDDRTDHAHHDPGAGDRWPAEPSGPASAAAGARRSPTGSAVTREPEHVTGRWARDLGSGGASGRAGRGAARRAGVRASGRAGSGLPAVRGPGFRPCGVWVCGLAG